MGLLCVYLIPKLNMVGKNWKCLTSSIFGIFCMIGLRAEQGIHFYISSKWQQVLNKAKKDNKPIFVDCMATWCGPCREMEETTYSSKMVSDFINSHFICIKVQMDTTARDDEQVKSWYSDANEIMKRFSVNNFPSFLFFSLKGEIEHKEYGYMDSVAFLNLLKNALDPQKQFYTLLTKYQNGDKDYSSMPYLIELLRKFDDKDVARRVSSDYLRNCLYKLTDNELYTRDRIELLASSIQDSGERGFDLFYRNAKEIDSLMKRNNYAEDVVDNIVYKEQLYPQLFSGGVPVAHNPNLDSLVNIVNLKYGEACAERISLDVKILWYTCKSDWSECVKYRLLKLAKKGLDSTNSGLRRDNNMIWTVIFKHSLDKQALNTALQWEESILKQLPYDPDIVDTYANLLYKLGKTHEAIGWEEKASELAPGNREIQSNFGKMKNGQPTWPVE